MKKSTLLASIIFLLLTFQVNAQNKIQSEKLPLASPEVPRVSAYEASVKFKAGKAYILHAGGQDYSKRRILGSFNFDETVKNKDEILMKFPKEGIEIFTYYY
jgi:hypothetical protein